MAAFQGMHASLQHIAMCEYQESVTTGQTNTRIDRHTRNLTLCPTTTLRRQHKNYQYTHGLLSLGLCQVLSHLTMIQAKLLNSLPLMVYIILPTNNC